MRFVYKKRKKEIMKREERNGSVLVALDAFRCRLSSTSQASQQQQQKTTLEWMI